MVQVIQGSNLRLLFADAPPSVSYAGGGNGYAGGGHELGGGYGVPPAQYTNAHPRAGQGIGREEILIVSDDRVLALRIKE